LTGTSLVDTAPGQLAWDASIILMAYALGAICSGYYLVRARTGLDLRREGSGALGGSNAARLLGPWAFVAVAVFDGLKGAVAVLAAQAAGLDGFALGCVVFAVVLGHIMPPQLGFHGGRGAATGLAAFLVYYPSAAVAMVLAFVVAYGATRKRMPSAVVGLAAAPVTALILDGAGVVFITVTATAALIAAAHRRRLAPVADGLVPRSEP
jgi:glycerol-3-phosphate acyltransferase PlsY